MIVNTEVNKINGAYIRIRTKMGIIIQIILWTIAAAFVILFGRLIYEKFFSGGIY